MSKQFRCSCCNKLEKETVKNKFVRWDKRSASTCLVCVECAEDLKVYGLETIRQLQKERERIFISKARKQGKLLKEGEL